MIEITGAITAVDAALNIAKAGFAKREQTLIDEASRKLTTELASALAQLHQALKLLTEQERAMAAKEKELVELRAALAQHMQAKQQYAGYELAEVARGVFVYAPQPGPDGRRPMPYLCPTCYQTGVHSQLDFRQAISPAKPKHLRCTANAVHEFHLPRGGHTPQTLGRPVT